MYCSWDHAAPVSWTETQFDFTRALSCAAEYVGGGVILWSVSHCWSSDLDQDVYAIRILHKY